MLAVTLRVFGFLLIALGCFTFIWPEIFTIAYGIELPAQASRSVVQGLIGGSEIGLGMVQVFHSRLRLDVRTLGMVAVFVMGGIAIVRLMSMMAYSAWSLAGVLEFGLEAACLMLLLVGLRREANGLTNKA